MAENNCKRKDFCFNTRENFLTNNTVLEQFGMGVREQELFVTESAKIGIPYLSLLFEEELCSKGTNLIQFY